MRVEYTPFQRGLPISADMRGYFAKMWMRKCKSIHKTLHPVGIRRQSHAENMDHLKRRSNVEFRLHNISPIIAQQDRQRASGTEMGVGRNN